MFIYIYIFLYKNLFPGSIFFFVKGLHS